MSLFKDAEGTELRYLARLASPADKRVLEIGCGEGRLTWKYAREAARVVAIDLDHAALRTALIDRPSDLELRVAFCRGDSVRLPFRNEAFDLAIFAWSF